MVVVVGVVKYCPASIREHCWYRMQRLAIIDPLDRPSIIPVLVLQKQ